MQTLIYRKGSGSIKSKVNFKTKNICGAQEGHFITIKAVDLAKRQQLTSRSLGLSLLSFRCINYYRFYLGHIEESFLTSAYWFPCWGILPLCILLGLFTLQRHFCQVSFSAVPSVGHGTLTLPRHSTVWWMCLCFSVSFLKATDCFAHLWILNTEHQTHHIARCMNEWMRS